MIRGLITFDKKNSKSLVIGLLFLFLSSAAMSVLPIFLILVQERIASVQTVSSAQILEGVYFIIGMIALGTFSLFSHYVASRNLAKYASVQVTELRLRLLQKILFLSPQALKDFGHNSLNSRVTLDTVNYYRFYVFLLIDTAQSVFRIILFITISIVIDPFLSLIYIPFIPLILVPSLIASKFSRKFYSINSKHTDAGNTIISESIKGIRVVKALNLKEKQLSRFNVVNADIFKNGYKGDYRTVLLFPVLLGFAFSSFAFLIIFGSAITAWEVSIGANISLNSSKIIAFSTYLFFVLFSVYVLTLLKTRMEKARPATRRIHEILNIKETIVSEKNLEFQNGNIVFKDMSFKFSEEAKNFVLENINLTIKKGSTIAIIGPTGSGKSMLAKMISRSYDPQVGAIEINNTNIKDFSVESLIENVSIVFQEKMLFSGTIRENIEMGNDKISSERLDQVAEISQAKEFIYSKEGNYEFTLAQRGGNLSGGQQQRISIARGIAKDSPILILDDSTSALDNITEKKIINALKETNDRTLVIISQRINSIKDIKQIVVMFDGKIEAVGNHTTLLKTSTVYQDICRSQEIIK